MENTHESYNPKPINTSKINLNQESEKDYDRNMVIMTLKAILALGYRIEKTK